MPVVFLKDDHENVLEKEPYTSFDHKFNGLDEEDMDGARITIKIPKIRGFSAGFTMDRCYCTDIVLKFYFVLNKASGNKEEYLIHHTITHGFDECFLDIEVDAANEVCKRAEYLYIPYAEYQEISYQIFDEHIEYRVDTLTDITKLHMVCCQLISQDIAIFSRGW